jgi:hypothetical protein
VLEIGLFEELLFFEDGLAEDTLFFEEGHKCRASLF